MDNWCIKSWWNPNRSCCLYADVQLKPHHIPFRMVQQWPTLIDRFSMGTEDEKSKGEMAFGGIL